MDISRYRFDGIIKQQINGFLCEQIWQSKGQLWQQYGNCFGAL